MHRIAVEYRGAADAEIAFDLLDKHPAEDVAPAIVVADANAGAMRRASQRRRVRLAARQGRQQVDAGETLEGVSDRKPLERGNGSAVRPRKDRTFVPAASAASARMAAQSLINVSYGSRARYHSTMVNSGWCSAPRFCGRAEHFGEFDDPALARRQELLAGQFLARCADRAGAKRRQGPRASSREACRWVSLPGETCNAAVSTSTKSSAATCPARPKRYGRAPTRTAGGRHARPRPRKAMRRGRWAASSP